MANQAYFPDQFSYTTYDIAKYSLWDETAYPASSSSFPNKIVDPSSDITEYSFCDELVNPTPSSYLPNHISYPISDVIGYPLSIDVADAAPASFFPSQISYTSSDISKYPLWDQQHGISTFGNGSLPNIPFDPFWGIEHNMGGLLEATAMNHLSTEENLMASTSSILVQENTFPVASNASVFSNIENDPDIKEAMKELKSRREMLLRDPNLKLNPAEIRLRDSCTRKIKYREMMSLLHSPTFPIHPLHIPPLIVDPALPLTVDPPSLATEEDESFKLLVDGF
nr:hypothetical protein Iba_chr07aCG6760 [Ipomoea batatas]